MRPPVSALLAFAATPGFCATEAGPWTRHTIDHSLAGADGTRLADFNGDGRLDFAVGWEQSGRSRIYLHPGPNGDPRNPWRFINAGLAPDVEDAHPADLDGDGRMDVLSCTDGHRRVIAHFAPRAEAPEEAWQTVAFPTSVVPDQNWMFSVTADVNRDGRPDLVLGGKSTGDTIARLGWLEAPVREPRDLSRWRFHAIGEVGWTMTLLPHDFNGDGWTDLFVSDRRANAGLQGLRWLENPGATGTTWRNHFIGAANAQVMFSDFADLTGDGIKEIVTVTHDRRILWYEQQDRGAWREHVVDWPAGAIGSIGKAVSAGDLNGDGRPELVVSTEGAAEREGVFVLSYPDSPYESRWTWSAVSGPSGQKFDLTVLIDLDEDGDLDILVTEEADNSTNPADSLGVVWYENPSRRMR